MVTRKTPKLMHDDNQPVILTVSLDTVARYLEAHEQVKDTLGTSPGAEFLMSLAVEYQDTSELVDLFSGEIIKALHRKPAAAQLTYES
jgi:hypothetical protein